MERAEAADVAGFLVADREFHLGLLELLGNRRLVRLVAQLRDQTRLVGLTELAREGNLTASAREHRDILTALRTRDADARRAADAPPSRAHARHLGRPLRVAPLRVAPGRRHAMTRCVATRRAATRRAAPRHDATRGRRHDEAAPFVGRRWQSTRRGRRDDEVLERQPDGLEDGDCRRRRAAPAADDGGELAQGSRLDRAVGDREHHVARLRQRGRTGLDDQQGPGEQGAVELAASGR